MDAYKKTCVITNIGTHYRFPIFYEMGKEIKCDFYLGDKVRTGIKTFDYHSLPRYKKTLKNIFFGNFYWQRGSVRLIFKPYHYYIIDGEPYCLSSWAILILSKFFGKEVIAWTHGWYGRECFVKRCIKKTFYALHSKLLVYNEYAINLMIKEGLPKRKMFCIANSLDSDKILQLRQCLRPTQVYKNHFNNNYPTVIYCGRIQKWKKLEQLIDSVSLLYQDNIPVNVVFVGKDVEGVNIYDYACSKEVQQQVWMFGTCYSDTVLGELFYNAHVCVSPGNVGLTAIHSLSFGCPVITHGNFPYQGPEFEAIQPRITGDFFEQDNINDLKEKIKKWICVSDEEREKTRKAAFTEIDRKWNIHYQIETMKSLLHE